MELRKNSVCPIDLYRHTFYNASPVKKYKLIANPVAGRGKTRGLISRVLELLARKGAVHDLELTVGPKEAGKIARIACSDFDVIVAVGGDGTVNEVVQGMVFSGKPLAVIPGGSGNDFTKALNVPEDVEGAVQALLNGKTKVIDAGKINNTYFANGVGVGFDAAVTRESRGIKGLRGLPLYLTALVKALGSYEPVSMKISMNGQVIEQKLFMLSIGNGTTCGGGFRLTPHAKLDDHLLDVTMVQPLGVLSIFRYLPDVFRGTIDKIQCAAMKKTARLTVESSSPAPAHVDGEVYTENNTSFAIEIIPNALTVIGNFT